MLALYTEAFQITISDINISGYYNFILGGKLKTLEKSLLCM